MIMKLLGFFLGKVLSENAFELLYLYLGEDSVVLEEYLTSDCIRLPMMLCVKKSRLCISTWN